MRLTTLGRGILVLGALLAVGGIALGLAAIVAVGVFMLALVALAASIVAETPQVRVRRTASPPEVERGAPAEVRLQFMSTSDRRPRSLTIIESVDGEPRVATIGPIPPGGDDQISYAVPTNRRGLMTAGPLLVRRFDALGLVTADRRFSGTCTVSVRPRRYPLRMLPSGRRRDLEGPTRERSEGSASFHQLREYVPGDDLRRIHWRSTAKTGQLLVKQMVDTTRPELVVVLDNRAGTIGSDDFEHAVEIAASVLKAAEDDDFPTTLLLSDGTDDLDVNGQTIPHLDRLTAVQRGAADSLSQLADVLVSRGRSLVFVTGEPTGPDLLTITKLAHGFAPAYLVSVIAERHAPLVAPRGMRGIACVDGEDFVAHWTSLR
ncbi:MAG: DUF58 domain-containing protein [Ilumatobacteraceae bacterium]